MTKIKKLLKLIESFRRRDHYYVDEDCWYSCPGHEDYCGDDPRVCLCGLIDYNTKVDEALQIVQGLINHSTLE